MIIDTSYFSKRLNLPQLGNALGNQEVEEFIDQYEPEILYKALGYSLAKAFIEDVEESGGPTEQRFIDLLDGKAYTYLGRPYSWGGFRNDAKLSPIANYVYYKFVENNASNVVLIGTVASTTDNNRNVNPMSQLVYAWNRGVDMLYNLYGFLEANKDVYPEWQERRNLPGWYWVDYFYPGFGYHGTFNYFSDVYEKKNCLDL